LLSIDRITAPGSPEADAGTPLRGLRGFPLAATAHTPARGGVGPKPDANIPPRTPRGVRLLPRAGRRVRGLLLSTSTNRSAMTVSRTFRIGLLPPTKNWRRRVGTFEHLLLLSFQA
jgi:hypothetical protein